MAQPKDPSGLSFQSVLRRFKRDAKPKGRIRLNSANPDFWNDPLVKQADLQMCLGHRDIETKIKDKALAQKFLDRVIGQWHAMGETEPYWSNDPVDKYKLDQLVEDALQDFYQDGYVWMDTLSAFESRSQVKIKNGVCVELGCGAGKYTEALAKRFQQVIAVDVSSGGLAVCAKRAKDLALHNVKTVLLTSVDDLASFGKIDFFVSLSTLQHNPPPVQRMLLDQVLSSLNPAGFCLFQTPDWIDGYTFSSKRYLQNAPEAMCDAHCLPKTVVLDILEENGMRLLDFAPDFTLERFGSYTFFAQKRDEPKRDAPKR